MKTIFSEAAINGPVTLRKAISTKKFFPIIFQNFQSILISRFLEKFYKSHWKTSVLEFLKEGTSTQVFFCGLWWNFSEQSFYRTPSGDCFWLEPYTSSFSLMKSFQEESLLYKTVSETCYMEKRMECCMFFFFWYND